MAREESSKHKISGVRLGRRNQAIVGSRIPNQARFAEALGTSAPTLNDYLKGKRCMSLKRLKQICDALDLQVNVRVVVEIWPKGEAMRVAERKEDLAREKRARSQGKGKAWKAPEACEETGEAGAVAISSDEATDTQ